MTMKKTALTLATAAAIVLGTVTPAHAFGSAPEHHRRYNRPSCFLALVFAAWDPDTLRANCGGHLRIT